MATGSLGREGWLQWPLRLLFDWRYFLQLSACVLLFEAVFGAAIVKLVPYTEIDWVAYMEEVGFYEQGELNYTKMRGGTGPLVYPAGFVYFFWVVKQLCDAGNNIRRAQWMFLGFYLCLTALVLRVYYVAGRRRIPPWVVLLLLLTKRVRSIFMLRLFNDGIATMIMYICVLMVLKRKWTWASIWFSVALSIKMNILLFLPAFGIMMLRNTGIARTALNMVMLILVQVAIGAEFLLAFPREYLSRAFEFSRVFFYKWTVNFRFLPEEVFVGKPLAHILLALTAVGVVVFVWKWTRPGGGLGTLFGLTRGTVTDSSNTLVLALFCSQLVGVVFARTLHYQFYSWYFHTLPFLLWHTRLPTVLRVAMLVGIEVAFNVFPSTSWSSGLLQACHVVLLAATVLAPSAPVNEDMVLASVNNSRSHDSLRRRLQLPQAAVEVIAVDSAGVEVEWVAPESWFPHRVRLPGSIDTKAVECAVEDTLRVVGKTD